MYEEWQTEALCEFGAMCTSFLQEKMGQLATRFHWPVTVTKITFEPDTACQVPWIGMMEQEPVSFASKVS